MTSPGSLLDTSTPPAPRDGALRSPDQSHQDRILAGVLLLLVLAVIAAIVFWPSPPDEAGQRGLVRFFLHAHAQGLPGWIDFSLVESASNVLMFAPIGFLGAIVVRRHSWLVVVAAAALSSAIEVGQYLFLAERVPSVHDVATNTLGALLGWLVALPWIRRIRRYRISRTRGRRLAG